ncbi:hypothetical protein BpHYR1_050991 [Brachionus plicatilis]|uniref:Uncharacterized protein n=1 Tax=Brachionus plicatilis TaxID=10195 RepID=A0A3M7QIJ4_BRAPC|nr:hypothetical protein BpHYR1_050991 [Brachionus plicatilis]
MSSASILENNFNDTVEDAEPLAKNKRSTDSEDEFLSKRPRIESDQNEAFDSDSKSCENCGSKMTKRRYWACPNKCAYSLNIFKLNGKKDLNPKPNT